MSFPFLPFLPQDLVHNAPFYEAFGFIVNFIFSLASFFIIGLIAMAIALTPFLLVGSLISYLINRPTYDEKENEGNEQYED